MNDQVEEEFDGIDGHYNTGGIDGKLLDGSIAPNGHLAGSSGGGSSSGSNTTEKPPHVHEYKETSRVEATCTAKGKITKTCVCGDKKTESIAVLGHNLEPISGSMNPGDCQTEGTVTHACSRCDYTEIILLSKGEHDYMKDTENSIPALCESKGKNVYLCSICGNSYEEVISETGHIWETEYTVDKEPTCVENGMQSIHCERCDEIKDIKELVALGHKECEYVLSDASFWENGKIAIRCEVCYEYFGDKIIPAKGGIWRYVIVCSIGLGIGALIILISYNNKKKEK